MIAHISNPSTKLPPEVLTRSEVLSLMAACSRRAPTGARNKALLAVLYRSLLRISEALDLKPKDYDRDALSLRVLHGKGDKARTVGLDPDAAAHIEAWLALRSKLDLPSNAPIFCTLTGERIKNAYIRQLLPRLAAKAGIDKRVHAHGLRHTGASELISEGVDIRIVSRVLGHSRIDTTVRYIDHLVPAAVLGAMRDRQGWQQ